MAIDGLVQAIDVMSTHRLALEYYVLVFDDLIQKNQKAITEGTFTPAADLRSCQVLPSLTPEVCRDSRAAWEVFAAYLVKIEAEMERILEQRPVFFWLHIYRRLGVRLHRDLPQSNNPVTVGLVRNIMDLAMSKYGSLGSDGELGHSPAVKFKDVLGGKLKHVWTRAFGARKAFSHWQFMATSSPQWVLVKFTFQDLLNVFILEGLAYEYWRASAAMRGLGKGMLIRNLGDNWEAREPFPGAFALIESYDRRAANKPFDASLSATLLTLRDLKGSFAGSHVVCALPNIEKRSYMERTASTAGSAAQAFIPNFLPGVLDARAYLESHAHYEEPFREKREFTLNTFLGCLWMLSNMVLFPPMLLTAQLDEKAAGITEALQRSILFHLSQRGYSVFGHSFAELIGEAKERAELFSCTLLESCSDEEISRCLRSMTLSDATRRKDIGLWSRGKHFPLIPYGSGVTVFELAGLQHTLNTLFVGIKDVSRQRGPQFEETFRLQLNEAGETIVHYGEIESLTGDRKEIDAAVKVNDTLILFECRAMEKPLDYERGKPDVFAKRISDFDKKITQVLELSDFIRTHPFGKNYNFSWAAHRVALVVSPFVEWTWERSPRLWLDAQTPRILSAQEAIAFLKHLRR